MTQTARELHARALALHQDIQNTQKKWRRQSMPRHEWNTEDQLDDSAARIEAAKKQAQQDRDTLRATVDAVTGSQLLSARGKQEKLAEALATARKHVAVYRAELDRARRELERRESHTGVKRVLRSARLVPAPASDADQQTKYLADLCERLAVRELRDELLGSPIDELTAAIVEADSSQQHAALCIAGQVLARRRAAGEPLDALMPASSAMAGALERIEPPRDVQRLEALFQRIANAAADVEDAVSELATGQQSTEVAAKTRRISELEAQGLSPADAGLAFASERDAIRRTQAERAAKLEVSIVDEAIAADAGAATTLNQ